MKKSSIILLSLVAAGAFAMVAISAIVTCFNNGNKTATITLDGTPSEKMLSRFSHLRFSVNDSIDLPGFYQDIKYPLEVVMRDDISDPVISIDPEWERYLTISGTMDTLVLDMDFHGLDETMEIMAKERRNIMFTGGPITIYIPENMLESLVADAVVPTCLWFLNNDKFDVTFGETAFFNCKIGQLNMTGLESLYLAMAFTDCTIDKIDMTTRFTTDVTIRGSGNDINSVTWHDNMPDYNASMTFDTSGIKHFNWLPANMSKRISFNQRGAIAVDRTVLTPDTVQFSYDGMNIKDLRK